MTTIAHSGRSTRWTGWRIASRIMQAAAIAAILYLIGSVLLNVGKTEVAAIVRETAVWLLALASVVYVLGHLLRAVRLALLIGGWQVGLRDIVSFHLMTAAASLAAPFKLGEIYRVLEMTNIAGGGVRGVVVAWWERLLDAILIFVLLAILFLHSSASAFDHKLIALANLAFIAMSAAIFWVLPENIRRVQVLIIRRHSAPATVWLLQTLEQSRQAIEAAPRVIQGKAATLATLTVLVWICEFAAFALAMAATGGSAQAESLFEFLTSVLHGDTLVSATSGTPLKPAGLFIYLLATHGILALVGMPAAVYYIRRRPAETFFPRKAQWGAL